MLFNNRCLVLLCPTERARCKDPAGTPSLRAVPYDLDTTAKMPNPTYVIRFSQQPQTLEIPSRTMDVAKAVGPNVQIQCNKFFLDGPEPLRSQVELWICALTVGLSGSVERTPPPGILPPPLWPVVLGCGLI